MADALVQLSRREGKIDRVPRGEAPVVELHLGEAERVISLDLRRTFFQADERKTCDWYWTAYVEWRSS